MTTARSSGDFDSSPSAVTAPQRSELYGTLAPKETKNQ
jgi:hypothetical protein